MENQIEKNFAGLTSAFDTSFQMEDKDVQNLITQTEKQVEKIEEKKNELVNNKTELMYKDQSFIEEELKTLIVSTRAMLNKLESEIKIGSKSGYYDSYARLSQTVSNQIDSLREHNVSVVQLELEKRRMGKDINTGKRVSIVLDANALMELVDKAKQNSQINKVDATFTVEENEG